ncbi:unnamed protein product [Absidia cylindrospora]
MSTTDNDEEVFDVENILDHRVDPDGEKVYFIKWKNYSSMYNSWEPEENLYCPALLKAYHARVNKTNQSKVAPKRKRSSPKPTTTKGRQKLPVTTMKNFITIPTTIVNKHIRKRPSLLVSMSLSKPAAQEHSIPASTTAQQSTSNASSDVDTTVSPPLGSDSDDTNTSTINSKKRHIPTTELPALSTTKLTGSDDFEISKRQKKSPQETPLLLDDLTDDLKRLPISTNHQKTPPHQSCSPTKLTNTAPQSISNDSGNPSTSSSFAAQSSNQRSQQNMQEQQNIVWAKDINVKSYGAFGLEFVLIHDPWQLQNNVSLFMKDAESTLTSVVSFNRTKSVCQQNNYCVMKIVPNKVNFPNWSKLSRFLHLNRQGVVLRSQSRQTEAILISNQFNLDTWTMERNGPLCALYVNDLEPDCVIRNGLEHTIGRLDSRRDISWALMSQLFLFPKELMDLVKETGTVFEVVGTSELAEMLRDTITSTEDMISPTPAKTSTKSSSPTTSSASIMASTNTAQKILFIDRFDGLLYQTSFRNERSVSNTRIFEFGATTVKDQISPPREAYPKNKGGYITTDAKNILQDTTILDRMVKLARKNTVLFPGVWRVILHDKMVSQIMRSGTGDSAQNAIFKILSLLNTNDLGILENWGEIPNEDEWTTATLDWFDTIVHTHLHTYEEFYFVDDSPSSWTYQRHYPLIHFIQSSSI